MNKVNMPMSDRLREEVENLKKYTLDTEGSEEEYSSYTEADWVRNWLGGQVECLNDGIEFSDKVEDFTDLMFTTMLMHEAAWWLKMNTGRIFES